MTEHERANALREVVRIMANLEVRVMNLLSTGKVETAMALLQDFRANNSAKLGWRPELSSANTEEEKPNYFLDEILKLVTTTHSLIAKDMHDLQEALKGIKCSPLPRDSRMPVFTLHP